jgi:hypothetical protein
MDPRTKFLNEPLEVIWMNLSLRIQAKVPIEMCKIGGPYIKNIFNLTNIAPDLNSSLRVLTQTAAAKT